MTIPTKAMPMQNAGGRQAKEFTPEQIEYVRANHEYRTQAEIMTHLGLTRHHMKSLLRQIGVKPFSARKMPVKSLDSPWSQKAGNEIFDVHEMEWL